MSITKKNINENNVLSSEFYPCPEGTVVEVCHVALLVVGFALKDDILVCGVGVAQLHELHKP